MANKQSPPFDHHSTFTRSRRRSKNTNKCPDSGSFSSTERTSPPRCILGYASRDLVRAGSAADHIVLGPDGDQAEGREGDDRIAGGGGSDVLFGEGGSDWLHGGDGNDRIEGGRGDDVLLGGPGIDRMNGGAGADRLEGGAGDDVIDGAENDDWVFPGEGRDQVNGGDGDDVIVAYHACELVAGETIVGGTGFDRFYSPLSRERLAAMGVVVEVEQFVVIPSSCLSSCGGSCATPGAADFQLGCEAACASIVACGRVDGLDLPSVADCVATCAAAPPPAACDARAVLDAQIACLSGSCADVFDCEVPSCE